MRPIKKITKALITTLISYSSASLAQSVEGSSGGVDVGANFSSLFQVALVVSALIGFYLFASGVYGFYTHSRTNGNGASIGGSFGKLIIGMFLVSVGWFYSLLKASFIGANQEGVTIESGQASLALDKAALAASQAIANSQGFGKFIPQGSVKALLAFVFLIGFIAFISGVYNLKNSGNNQAQNPILSPSLKIIGGMICMNITWFACLIAKIINIPALCGS